MPTGMALKMVRSLLFALPQRPFSCFFLGNIPAYRLVFGDLFGRIEDRPVAPSLPLYSAIRHDDPVVDGIDRMGRGQGFKELFHALLVFGRDVWPNRCPSISLCFSLKYLQ